MNSTTSGCPIEFSAEKSFGWFINHAIVASEIWILLVGFMQISYLFADRPES